MLLLMREQAISFRLRLDGVVPFAMEVMACQIDGGDLGVGDFDAGRIGVLIEFAAHLKAGVCFGRRDELNNGVVAHQRLAAPVLG